MEIIIKNGIRFNNVPTSIAKGYTGLLTNIDNVTNNKYKYDSESDPIISALDINWCGAEVAPGVSINTTDELLNWIKNNNGITSTQQKTLEECKNVLDIFKDYILRNQDNNENPRLYWYCGTSDINESTWPGSSTNWHIINGKPTSIETGEMTSEEKVNWVLAIPVSIGLNHISNGEDVTDAYDIKFVTNADGIEYKVYKQISPSKKTDRKFI